ncbi:MAG TPA: ADP-ribosylglycohydrolase family protein [Tissierellaceae bacterium]
MSNIILDGIMGLAVGDALGVPVEFESRDALRENPVVGMRGYGTHNQPAGTWSDDTSLTLCLVDSLCIGLNYYHIMNNFIKWLDHGEFTPHGKAFGIGNTTNEALIRFKNGVPPLLCGGKDEHNNGNGSLMRILPILYFINSIYGSDFQEEEEAFEIIHDVSSLTHAHKRSQMACGIYISIAAMLISHEDLDAAVELGIKKAMDYYKKKEEFQSEIEHFSRMESRDFKHLPEEEMKSNGYVVSTLEAAIWCLLNTNDYKSCVLKAVNLGDDTDTVGAVAGGLAGLKYGYDSIPEEWKESLARRDYIEGLCNQLYKSLAW